MKPLGKNNNGYCGEKIDVRAVLKQMEEAIKAFGWSREVYYKTDEFQYEAIRRPAESPHPSNPQNIYISTGIHGDEPAGPLAILELLEKNEWPQNANLFICPCLNPGSFILNKRENPEGIDLNRDYRNPKTEEVKAHMSWLEKQPCFDLSLCLHEDWEAKGFYIYSNQTAFPLAKKIINEVEKVFPIDYSTQIDNFPAKEGIIISDINMLERIGPEAFYLRKYKKSLHYTFETSSDFLLEDRVRALMVATETALNNLAQ